MQMSAKVSNSDFSSQYLEYRTHNYISSYFPNFQLIFQFHYLHAQPGVEMPSYSAFSEHFELKNIRIHQLEL